MPYLSSIPTDSTVLPKLGSAELVHRVLKNNLAWQYYDGEQKKFLKVKEGEIDHNIVVNLCARVVDQSVNFMVGSVPTFDLPGEDQNSETILDAWLKANDFEDFINDLMIMSAITGHAFVKLLPDGAGNVRPIVLDSSLVTVFWDPGDKSKVLAYMIKWSNPDTTGFREDHINLGASWEIISYTGKGEEWTETGREFWQHPFAQIVDWKNLPNARGYYGKSDLDSVIPLNDAYNFRQSNTNKILYIHAHPRTIGVGLEKTQIEKTSIDGLWTIPEGADLKNLEMQSDLESSRANANDIKADFFSDSQTVDLAVVKDKAGSLTNFGLKLLFTEALSKNNKKRRLAGRGVGVPRHPRRPDRRPDLVAQAD
jgi:hypothetical protein